ncbi:MAG: class I SAM-dependent methyltransferase [Sphingobacteriales bacterium]|nr:MAG: class I SAM-dependent methyltransferase [Sphingobacteriales bacterium]
MKQTLAQLLRRLGLIYFVDFLRYRMAATQARDQNQAFRKQHPSLALPEPYMIYETFRMDYARYYTSGRETATEILQAVASFTDLRGKVILDWGCGPGRVIRHFPALLPDTRCYGSDYNPAYVRWCAANLPEIHFEPNGLTPPLPFADQQFALVYALSIFTHLSEENHFLWMQEILRVLEVGGLFYFTTHGQITRQNLLPAEQEQFDSGKPVIRGQVKEGHRMYATYHPESFVKSLFEGRATLMQHAPGTPQSWGLQQDVWIIRKDR